MSKLLTVVGATGQQGGSVISWVSSHPRLSKEFKIRALTRNPAKANFASDIEVRQADLNDVESLKQAFQGSDTVFGVTNYWEQCDKEYEKQQGINIADAAIAVGVRHLIWSGSTNVAKYSNGQIKDCEYFDNKAEVMEYIDSKKPKNMIVSYPTPAVFMQTTINLEIKRQDDGCLIWPKPWDLQKTRVPLIDAWDSGGFVVGIMAAEPQDVDGLKVLGTGEWLSPEKILKDLSEVIGEEVRFVEVTDEQFIKALPKEYPAPAALTANMTWMREYGYFGPGAEEKQRESSKFMEGMHVKTWKEFLQQQMPLNL